MSHDGDHSQRDARERISDPSSYLHDEHAGTDDELPPTAAPAYMEADALAAGEDRPLASAQAIGVGVATEAHAAHDDPGQTRIPGGFPAFDAHHPPAPDLIADCVHCGFCLPTCPTYLLWGEEMDSPRGRIYLMKAASEGRIGMNDGLVRHMDQCLGCMACVTACPSGVQYDKLIEATRSQVERRYARTSTDRFFRSLLFALFPHPDRLRLLVPALWLYQRLGMARLTRSPLAQRVLPARLRGMEAVMPSVRLADMAAFSPKLTPARGTPRRRVGLLAGCLQRVLFSPVNAATIRVLSAEGCDVLVPTGQGCCGALAFHAGREDDGLNYARRLIDTFEQTGVDTIVVNAAGCGSTLKEYAYLLRDDPGYAERARAFSAKVRDVSELLDDLETEGMRAPRHELAGVSGSPLRVAYHDACHLGHAQGVRRQPRAVLRRIPGLQLVDIPEAEICCGSAGIYNLVEPEPATELGARKARNILSASPDVIATANPGCLLQITSALERLGEPIPTVHPIELVDASIRGVPVEQLARGR
ncbi:MAG TPA: heterodisulfide reductase-related iron-sulfur binding cluster [Ktedonobacterales bacterium]